MSRYSKSLASVVLTTWLVTSIGCQPQQPFYFGEDGDLSHYLGEATNIEGPDFESETLSNVDGTLPPLDLENPDPSERWELSLEDAVKIALKNSNVMRNLGGVSFGPNGTIGEPSTLLSQPEGIPSTWDPSRTESDPRFGVEAAMAAFDAQMSTSVYWEKNDTPANVQTGGVASLFRPTVLEQDLGTFQTRLQKFTAPGGVFSLTHNVRYEQSNLGLRQWPSDWNVNVEAEFRQPVLQGAGVAYNRIAGPGAIPGYNAGVMIARLRHDVSLVDFEAAVRNLVRDVEKAYWELYFAYRRLDAACAGRDATLQTWRQTYAAMKVGGISGRDGQTRGSAQDEAQSRLQYYSLLGVVQQAQSNLFKTENHVRYIIGIEATDGRLIRPSDEPTIAKVEFDWYSTHAESLSRSVELRRQKWRVKARELELIAAKNYLLPRLDLVGRYRWLGLGDHMINPSRQADPFDNAYQSMTGGDFQEWQLGIEFSHTLGFRKEMAGVRNAQMNLARDRAVLREQELELSHQLTHAFRELHDTYVSSRTNFNRRVAAEDEVEAVNAAYQQDTATLDRVLDAQRRMAESENDYFRSVVEYNQAIATLHYRKGSLLEYNGVYLAEGPWPGKAYFDARRRARARDASMFLDYGFTRPNVISRGPIEQHSGSRISGQDEVIYETTPYEPMLAPLESIPSRAPVPQDAPLDSQSHTDAVGNRPVLSEAPSSQRSTTVARVGKRHDLASLNLQALAGKPAKPSQPKSTELKSTELKSTELKSTELKSSEPRESSMVDVVSFEKPVVSKEWKSTKRSSPSNVRSKDPTPASTRWSASNWKSIQH